MKKQLPIKFRGRFWNKDGDLIALGDPKDGDFIYGGYARMTLRLDVGEGDYIIDKEGEALLIYPDSVKQLVGYDKNGREVYEGDALQTENGVTIYAYVLRHAKIAPTKDLDFTEMAKEDGWTVKEAEGNEN